MARDVEQRFRESERLFKQGRAQVAVRELRQLAEQAGSEPLILNRVGDVLARNGHRDEAVVVFDRIASDLAGAGLYPKSIAVLKKTLRMAPDHLPAILLLGEVYAKQDVIHEARSHLLRAGERFLKSRQLASSQAIYEKLVEVDPRDPLHRVRVAEAKVLGGKRGDAADDLVGAGSALLRDGRAAEAEKTFRRAAELAPERTEPLAGMARCLVEQSRGEDAVALLEGATSRPGVGTELLGELCCMYERMGRTERSMALLATAAVDQMTGETFEEILRIHAGKGHAEEGWKRLAPALDRWTATGQLDRVVPVLERLANVDGQDVIALERLRTLQRALGPPEALAGTLERLVQAYWSRSAHGPASTTLEELKSVAPQSRLVAEGLSRRGVSTPAAAAQKPAGQASAVAAAAPAAPAPPAPPGPKVLAVPESHSEREFVSSRLTEAEAFQKYNLPDSAEQQLREVTRRFPGHVEAQGRLAALLRARKDTNGLQATLVDLALARAAGGDTAGAHEAAKSAAAVRPLPATLRGALEQASLFGPSEPGAKPAPAARPAPTPPPTATLEPEIEIMFGDDDDSIEVPEGLVTAPTGEPGARIPPADALDEIQFFLDQGMRAEALDRIATLRKGGFTGERVDALERRAALGEVRRGPGIAGPSRALDDDDLNEISEALEFEVVDDEDAAVVDGAQPEAGEQSVEDVFAAFKEQVAGEIGTGDFRAHYDLGIAYKEMGLVDDAAREFEQALASPALHREACAMLALCHRERGEIEAALRWYREALDAIDPDSPEGTGLRYDLADTLAAHGDERGALDMFTSILALDPDYRDVPTRVTDLKSRIGR